MRDYEVVVVGTGPAGEGAAMMCAKNGKRVAVVERHTRVGGGCTHWGTIPSKALRHAIQLEVESRIGGGAERAEVPELLARAQAVIGSQTSMREDFYRRNDVPLIAGSARFEDAHTLAIADPSGIETRVTADAIFVATGSRPWRPPEVDFTHRRVFDADTILGLDWTPRSLTIYGAGVIGCEYASMFRALGVKVNLVNQRAKLLEFLDDEIIDALAYHLRDMGAIVRHQETLERLHPADDCVIATLVSGKQLRTDALLWANGRTPNTDGLGLDALGISLDHRGRIAVDEHYRTAVPHIYAIGDAIGPPGLASASYDQGRFAAAHCCTGEVDQHLIASIPTGIYTTPEISSIGPTERELTERAVPYEVGHAFFKSLARAQITGRTVGMLKLLFHIETLELLAVHCFGYSASEIVHIGQAIMRQPAPNNRVTYFVETTFNYPTMAEAYRVAALNGLNRLRGV